MKKLLIIHTGGTIASKPVEGKQGVEPVQFPSLPKIDGVEIIEKTPFSLPSPHIKPKHMLEIVKIINNIKNVDGVVITHGTDTLEETAYMLHLLIDNKTPVILTGSMRHADEPSWDGPANILDAIGVALDQNTRKETLVVFAGDIFDARTVTKIHSTALDAFGGYPGAIGRIDRLENKYYVHYFAYPKFYNSKEKYFIESLDAKVEILYAYAGWEGEGFLEAENRADGIVIAAMGAGNLPAEILSLIKNTKKPVVIATRTDAGAVVPVYGYDGGGATLRQSGAIMASFLNAHKARILLLVLLSLKKSHQEIKEIFANL